MKHLIERKVAPALVVSVFILILVTIFLEALPRAHAADVSAATWSPTDASNTSASPNGWPPNMAPNQVAPVGRAMMGGLKRWYNARNMTVTSTGSANAQVITYSPVPTACVAGDGYVFKAGFTNTGAMTLANGACTAAVQIGPTALSGGEVVVGRPVEVYYDGTVFQIVKNTGAFWDAVNRRLGIGTAAPTTLSNPGMEIKGAGTYGVGLRLTSTLVGGHAYELAPAWQGTQNTGFSIQDVNTGINFLVSDGGSTNATLNNAFTGSLNLGFLATAGNVIACITANQYLSGFYGFTLCSSDERLKDIYGGLPSASDMIDRLKPTSFSFKSDKEKTRHSGFIAQQVGLVMPECQTQNPDGYYSIDTNCILAYTVKAQQESRAQIQMLYTYLWIMAALVICAIIAMCLVVRRRPV